MKVVILYVAIFVLVSARPEVEIIKSESDVQPDHYIFNLETSDGTSRHEEGVVKDAGTDHAAISVQGSFSYKDEKDGKQYSVSYIADENGFQPTGEHLPPLPAIQH
ncbi:larval cuticle protein 65Ab1 [Bactrocera oleae]|uniref:larval cuticle protein 65Ab1 n=1 Tax=Bactrocera oleae TaxID=104688 RepID=UPI0006B85BE3|nr:larval cuticle protein 65Ab1 [Bactrocera oleae]XP_036228280.1 larval cuticle protein 65Ab1 [Bactrocera oleae]